MATRTRAPRAAAQPSRATANAGLRNAALARPFLPSLDLIEAGAERFKLLDAADKRQVIETKIADVTHFRVGLGELRQHAKVALDFAAEVRPLPKQVRGVVLDPAHGGRARERAAGAARRRQPARPRRGDRRARHVHAAAAGDERGATPHAAGRRPGAALRRPRRRGAELLTVPVPPTGAQALGELVLAGALEPLPQSVVGALIDLIEDLPAFTPGGPLGGPTPRP